MNEFTRSVFRRIKYSIIGRKIKSLVFRGYVMNFPTFSEELHEYLLFGNDYSRYATMYLAIQRLKADKIQGSIAEVGVYKGETSKVLSKLIDDRKYYLFDTFEGFPQSDLESGVTSDERFRDTSIEEVLKKVPHSDNFIIRKGYVPETLTGLEDEKFAFVLLDMDLYKPTKDSLEFFYPRINKGGYLFIHDYNNSESDWACSRAVNEFMKDKLEKIIEIPDANGTVMFRKL